MKREPEITNTKRTNKEFSVWCCLAGMVWIDIMAYYRFNEIQFENWNFDLDIFTDYAEYVTETRKGTECAGCYKFARTLSRTLLLLIQ